MTTTNVVPLADGPSLFFAQKMEGDLNECDSGVQTIQVAWNGGVTYISGDVESDLFQYYTGLFDVLEFWFRMHRFPSQTSTTTTIFTNCAFPPLMKSSKFQCWPTRSKTQTTTPICTAKLMSAPALLRQMLKMTFSKKDIRFARIRSRMKYSSRICEAMNASSCMTSWGEMSSRKESVLVQYKCLQQTQGMYFLTILNKTNQTTFKLIKRRTACLWTQQDRSRTPSTRIWSSGFLQI